MKAEKRTRDHLIAIRLNDAEFARLQVFCKREGRGASCVLRDFFNAGSDPLHQREQLALLKKIAADLSYCRQKIIRECSDATAAMLRPFFISAAESLDAIGKGGGTDGDHKTGSSHREQEGQSVCAFEKRHHLYPESGKD